MINTKFQAKQNGLERFDSEATKWDNNPFIQSATLSTFRTLQPIIYQLSSEKGPSGLEVLEVGCGTGLLSLYIAPLVDKLVSVDAAPGMIEVLKTKLALPGAPQNITPLLLLLENPEDPMLPPQSALALSGAPRKKFDLILSHLVMHHVPDLKRFIRTLWSCLNHGGRVALTDFEDFGPLSIMFHPKSRLTGVARHGIHRVQMELLMEEVGFEDVKVWTGWTMQKEVKEWEGYEGRTLTFPFLVCEGMRR